MELRRRQEGARVEMEHCPSTPPRILFVVVNKTEEREKDHLGSSLPLCGERQRLSLSQSLNPK